MSYEHRKALDRIAKLCENSCASQRLAERVLDIAYEGMGMPLLQREQEITTIKQKAIQARRDKLAQKYGVTQ